MPRAPERGPNAGSPWRGRTLAAAGLGALIAVPSGGVIGAFEVTYIRSVVWLGMLTVVAALTPVKLGPYGLGEHEVWVLSALVAIPLGGALPLNGLGLRGRRAARAAYATSSRSRPAALAS